MTAALLPEGGGIGLGEVAIVKQSAGGGPSFIRTFFGSTRDNIVDRPILGYRFLRLISFVIDPVS